MVSLQGEVLYRHARGMASLELGIPLEADMVLNLASVTKQFTAIAILILFEQGQLDLDDPIEAHIPEFPASDPAITIQHLLSHTSGIINYTSLPEWLPLIREDISPDGLINLFRAKPLPFPPGQRFDYSNSGYALLGRIIERVSGMTYGDFIGKAIFNKLGMRSSRYDNQRTVVPRLAPGYDQENGTFVPAKYISRSHIYSAGALMSTVDDLQTWDESLYTDQLLKLETLNRAFTPFRLCDGASAGYGYGWAVGDFGGQPWIEHTGGMNGFSSHATRLPQERIFVAVLSNQAGADTKLLSVRIANVLLGRPN